MTGPTPLVLFLDVGQLAGDAKRLRSVDLDRVGPTDARRMARTLRGASYSALETARRLEAHAQNLDPQKDRP